MKDIFEQFQFIKPMLNTASSKAQDSGFWAGIGTAVSYCVTHGFTYMADTIVGISLYMLVAFFAIMVVDYITGYRASRKEGDKPQSKKGLRWVVKLFAYLFALYIVNALAVDSMRLNTYPFIQESITFILEVFKYFVLVYIVRWETKSIDENLQRLGYKFKIFRVFDIIFDGVIGVFNKSIKDKTGVDNVLKEMEVNNEIQIRDTEQK